MLGQVRGEARDGAGLVVVFKEDGCPAVGGGSDEVLCACDGAFELGESPVARRGLKFIGALANVDDVLGRLISA